MAKKTKKKKAAKKKTTKKTAKKEEENEAKSWLTLGIGIIIVIGLFVGFYFLGNWLATKDYVEYNGFLFVPSEDKYWRTEIQQEGRIYTIQFYHNPEELETIPMDREAEKFVIQKPEHTYITVNPDDPSTVVIAGVEIAKILGTGYKIFDLETSSALLKGEEESVPIKTCTDADVNNLVIEIRVDKENRVHTEGRCIIIEGSSPEEAIKTADRFVFSLLGIMNP